MVFFLVCEASSTSRMPNKELEVPITCNVFDQSSELEEGKPCANIFSARTMK